MDNGFNVFLYDLFNICKNNNNNINKRMYMLK